MLFEAALLASSLITNVLPTGQVEPAGSVTERPAERPMYQSDTVGLYAVVRPVRTLETNEFAWTFPRTSRLYRGFNAPIPTLFE